MAMGEMAEMAASATHELREILEHLAAELRETEAGFRLLIGREQEDAIGRLRWTCSRLVDVVAFSERQLADARTRLETVLATLG